MDRKILIIICAVVIVVAAGATYALSGNNDSNNGRDDGKDKDPYDYSDVTVDMDKINANVTNRLVIYGNANNDDNLDEDDLTFLKYVVAHSWDKEKFPFCDVNNDGKVDKDDVLYLEKILAKKETVNLYYNDTWNTVSYAHWPDTVTGNIGTMYWEQASAAVVLGVWDRVTATGSGSLSEQTNPGWDKLYSYGKGYNADVETVLASALESNGNVKSLIAYMQSDGTAKDIYKAAVGSKSSMSVLVPSASDYVSYILTLGVLLGAEDRAHSYASTTDSNINYMKEQLKGYNESNSPSIMVIMLKSGYSTSQVHVLGPATAPTSANGAYKYMAMLPSKILLPDESVRVSFYTEVTAEWVQQQNPDYIYLVMPSTIDGVSAAKMTKEEYQAAGNKVAAEIFGGTQAYANGNIIFSANGLMNSFAGGFACLKAWSMIYDEIDSAKADAMFDSWYEGGWVYYQEDDKPNYLLYRIQN